MLDGSESWAVTQTSIYDSIDGQEVCHGAGEEASIFRVRETNMEEERETKEMKRKHKVRKIKTTLAMQRQV